ncbi:MAG: sensor histidine kinase response regulator, partial [Deltaproteobacteria bacterium]|nr:sensor histidine kinase response regulator [Deltaproteobacteria bacterium]
MPPASIQIGSALLLFVAAWKSLSFILRKRIGKVWILVFLSLFLKGVLSFWVAVSAVEFFLSLLLAAGFLLTGKWFDFKERIDARNELISEVDRSLVGALEEDRILSRVCEILSRQRGYRLAWVGVAEPDGSIRPIHSAGDAAGFLSEARFRWDGTPSGDLPPGIAARTGETRAMRNGEPDSPGPAEVFRRHGLRSCISARIDPSFLPHKVLTVHSDVPGAFESGEADAFSAMARRVGDAIQSARRHETYANAKSSYDDLLRNQRDGVLLVREGKVVRANPAAAELLGYRLPELLFDLDPSAILVEGDASPNLRYALRGPGPGPAGSRSEWEAAVRRRDGSTFDAEISVTWIPRGNRKETFVPQRSGPLGMILLRDVTNRVRIMNDLRGERDFSARILEVSGALVLQLGKDGKILLFNRQCEETTGWASREVLGKSMPEFLLPEPMRGAHAAALDAVLAGRAAPPLETRIVTASEEERLITWKYAPLHDASGEIASVIVTGIDVTDRRLLEKQIIEMQKMEAVGTLAGGIAHDFNNILTGILGSLDTAQRRIPEGSGAATPISDAIRASERAVHLIRQLLDFSRRSP